MLSCVDRKIPRRPFFFGLLHMTFDTSNGKCDESKGAEEMLKVAGIGGGADVQQGWRPERQICWEARSRSAAGSGTNLVCARSFFILF